MISIIMACYNEEKNVSKAIESILGQTFSDFEFIICNDGSTDGTLEILKEYEKKDSRIKIINNEKNLRLSASLNKCIESSKGIYIARMDADDISSPNRLLFQKQFLDENKQYGFCSSNIEIFNEQGVYGKRICIERPEKNDFLRTSPFVHPATMFRKSTLSAVNLYTTDSIGRAEDYELFAKMYAKGIKGYNIQQFLLKYYEGENSWKKRTLKAALQEVHVRKRIFLMLNLYPRGLFYQYKPLFVKLTPAIIRKIVHIRNMNHENS